MDRKEYYIGQYNQLSVRARAVLSMFYHSCYRIYAFSDAGLSKISNCGAKTASEIINFRNNLIAKYPFKENEQEDFKVAFQDCAINENLSILSISARKYIIKNSINTFSKLLSCLENISNISLQKQIEHYVIICDDYAQKMVIMCLLNCKYGKHLDAVLTGKYNSLIQKESLINPYVKTIRRIYNCYDDVLFVDIEQENIHRKSFYDQCRNIRDKFYEEINELLLIEDNQVSIMIKCPSLTFEELTFINQYELENKIIPVFFVIQKLLSVILSPRQYELIMAYFGFYENSNNMSTLLESINMSRDRVLPIIGKTIRYLFQEYPINIFGLSREDIIRIYPFLNNVFFTEQNTNFVGLVNKERLNYSFAGFCFFCYILNPYLKIIDIYLTHDGDITKYSYTSQPFTSQYSYNEPLIIVGNGELFQFDFYNALRQIHIEMNKSSSDSFDWKRYCFKPSLWQNGIVQELVPDVMELLAYLLNKLWGITDSDDSRYSDIEQGEKVNVREFLYEYVKAQNKPVSVDEMFLAFKEEYPSYPFTDSDQIRTYLCKDERLQPIGRSSLYVVAGSQQFKGSLQTAVIEVLKKVKDPIGKEEIYKAVLSLRPDSSENSLRTILASMVKSGILQKTEDTQYFLNKKTKSE